MFRRIGALAALVASFAIACAGFAAAAAAPAAAETLWLCNPRFASNPCLSSEQATVALGNGATFLQPAQPASNPPVDCFYVYPTVSSEPFQNATVTIGPEEEAIAVAQASRFSQVCKVYAPIYPQLTIPAIQGEVAGASVTEGAIIAYLGVVSAFEEYLTKYNEGRGIVLIGHSQGAAMLEQLIREQIEPYPWLRKRLVSAIILGGNVIVPEGKPAGGTFKDVPACASVLQTGCVLAYSSFLETPPEHALFGRPESSVLGLGSGAAGVEDPQVLCVNPTLLVQNGSEGALFPYYPTTPFPGKLGPVVQVPKAPTPWVTTPGEYSAQCRHEDGASWLNLKFVGPPGDPRERIKETLGEFWGTHLVDVNVALGNLVPLVGMQSLLYELGGGSL